ncbi:hypothetical protein [Dactylosporangium sp. CA-233914]|uniref:hypothetical protein n=1 Tax=Dactylosporangium sp. CA-233914 TaxID=3239934 RepID=UPI003D8BE6C7
MSPAHGGRIEADTALLAHRFVTRLIGGDAWVIAATAARLPVPGWPPTEQDVA